MSDPRSRIPSIDALLGSEPFARLLASYPRARIVEAARGAVEDVRRTLGEGADVPEANGAESYARAVEDRLASEAVPSLRRVVNATGVVLHTNLGRAPFAEAAVRAMLQAVGYANLEYDLEAGARGSRYVHCVSLLRALTGAEDALVVNNAAAALVLALNSAAGGAGVVVSRGELVEIGGGFRIPEIVERAGAGLVEVGSTNRTRRRDYGTAIEAGGVRAILKVHRSNFRISGFTEEATLAELSELAQEAGIPLVHDLGSGLMVESSRLGLPFEPRPVDALAEGADVVVFSGDKLLGGPQAGIVLGRRTVVSAMRANPLCRALRVDKVTLAALEATLRLYRDTDRAIEEIPVLRMLAAPEDRLRGRCERLAECLVGAGVPCSVVRTSGAVGGGTFPGTELPSWAIDAEARGRPGVLADLLRDGEPAVVARVRDERLLLDVRTVAEDEEEALVGRLVDAVARLEARARGAAGADGESGGAGGGA